MIENIGTIEVKIKGKIGENQLTPDLYDVRDIKQIIDSVDALLFPSGNRKEILSYKIEEGSVRQVFTTAMQVIIGYTACANTIIEKKSIDFLTPKSASAIEFLQNSCYKTNFEYEIITSIEGAPVLRITPQTNYIRKDGIWVDTELYYYGKVFDAGGKSGSNIHVETSNGTIKIKTSEKDLANRKDNILYHNYGVRVRGKQNILTNEIDNSTLILIELIDYNPVYDENYINELLAKAAPIFNTISSEDWERELSEEL